MIDTDLPFGGYSPLIPGKRGVKVGGSQIFSDFTYYGCCASIGAAGVGIFLQSALLTDADKKTLSLHFLQNGEQTVRIGNSELILHMVTEYPLNGKTTLNVLCKGDPIKATVRVRIPKWAEELRISADCGFEVTDGYAVFEKEWQGDTQVEIDFSLPFKLHQPKRWEKDTIYYADPYEPAIFPLEVHQEEKDKNYIAITKGPITLGADSRLGRSADAVFDPALESGKPICERVDPQGFDCNVMYTFKDMNGEDIRLVDYASAGKDWKSPIAAWLPTK